MENLELARELYRHWLNEYMHDRFFNPRIQKDYDLSKTKTQYYKEMFNQRLKDETH